MEFEMFDLDETDVLVGKSVEVGFDDWFVCANSFGGTRACLFALDVNGDLELLNNDFI